METIRATGKKRASKNHDSGHTGFTGWLNEGSGCVVLTGTTYSTYSKPKRDGQTIVEVPR